MAFRTTDVTEQMDSYDKFITDAKLTKEPHQRVGVSWMVKKELSSSPSYGVRGGLISDEMGLGKTIQSIGLIQANPVNKTIIVVPPALLDQWKNEIERTTDIKPLVFHGQKSKKITEEEVKASPITLTTYDMLGFSPDKKATAKYTPRTSPCILHTIDWNRIICDEAHKVRHIRTSRFIGVHQLTKKSPTAPVWLMTGTPVQNSLKDFKTLCKLIGLPESVYNDMTVFAKVVNEFFLRRTKVGLKIEMPSVTIHPTIVVPWKSEEEKELARNLHEVLAFTRVMKVDKNQDRVDEETSPRKQEDMTSSLPISSSQVRKITASFNKLEDGGCVFPHLIRSRQVCLCPSLLKESVERMIDDKILDTGDEDDDTKKMLEVLDNTSKIDQIVDHVTDRATNFKTNTIVFAHFRGEIDTLRQRFRDQKLSVAVLDGRTDSKKRAAILSQKVIFDVLIIQIQSGSEGLNLQGYNDVVFTSPHWNPAIDDQAIARAWRMGQKREVNVFNFAMESFTTSEDVEGDDDSAAITLDTYCQDVQSGKRDICKKIFGLSSAATEEA